MPNTVALFRVLGRALLRVPKPLRLLAPLAWMAVIWWTSAQSPTPGPRNWGWRAVVQNFLHAPSFGFLGLLLLSLLPQQPGPAGRPWLYPRRATQLLLLGLVLAYGVVDELHQGSVPGRDLSVLDLITDVTGAASVLWIVQYLGGEDANESGLARRFALGLAACLAAAILAAYLPYFIRDVHWI